MSNDFTIERISRERLKDLLQLYRDAFNKKVSLSYLQKKYNTLVFGAEFIGYIAYRQGIPAAYYGVFPCSLIRNGEIILAAQSGDTMTHSNYRRQGLFSMLAKATYELAKQNGIHLIFGFPNESSFPGFIKNLQWVNNENFRFYRIKVSTLPIAKLAQKIHFFSSIYQWKLKIFLSLFYRRGVKPFRSSAESPDKVALLRNDDFYNYKSFTPNHIVQIGKCAAWIKVQGALLVGDLERTENPDVKGIIAALKRLAFITGCTEILFNFSPGTFWDMELSRILKAEEGLPVGFLDLGRGIQGEKMKFTFGDLDTF